MEEKEVLISNFKNPLEMGFNKLLSNIRNKSNAIAQVNIYKYMYSFVINPIHICKKANLHMIFLVKI